MSPHTARRDVKAVKQGGKRRAEKPVAQKIGGKVHQYGCIDIHEPDPEKEVYRIVDRKQEQRHSHNPPGTPVILEYCLLRCLAEQEIEADEQHQRQCY